MTCPDCNGSGIEQMPCGPDDTTCDQCGGSGQVPDEQAEWIEQGRQMRERRLATRPFYTQYEEALRRGLTVQEYSQMEAGRCKPVEP